MSDNDIAAHMNISVNELRRQRSIAREQERTARYERYYKLKDKGFQTSKIAEMCGVNESSVRTALAARDKERVDKSQAIAKGIEEQILEKGMIDIGTGVELELGISQTRLNTAVDILKEKGYTVHSIYVEQANNPGQYTTVKVICPPGTEKSYVLQNKDKIQTINAYSHDGGETIDVTAYPKSISSSRIDIRYANGKGDNSDGLTKDGLIEIRPGVPDLSLGNSNYAQVRIAVDGTHYLKGMARYSTDLPDGVDIVFNTNKTADVPKMKVLKALKDDDDLPFGAKIKANGQYYYKFDEDGKMIFTNSKDKDAQLGAINKVNEEGDWDGWAKTLSSQFLSKQNLPLIQRQLNLSYAEKKQEYDEIMALTNPVIKKQLLNAFAADCDSSAVDLKAAALPRQKSHVLLPFNEIKETEIYAPNYKDGERVVLIRYPHGGIFEIPELTVNNKVPLAKKILGNATDAVGINFKVAEQLSGADFDGDTALIIPVNSKVRISNKPYLEALKGFDAKAQYKLPEDAPKMKSRTKQTEMGKVSNLITDMTLRGATDEEIVRAVKHSMVVIDAEKHHLDYKQSELDNDIRALKTKYQGGPTKGASTLISRASSTERVKERVLVDKDGKRTYTADPETGEFLYKETGRTYTDKKGKVHFALEETTKMANVKDARLLSSGDPKEEAYAHYANNLKALANESRKQALAQPGLNYSPNAAKVYEKEVDSLSTKLQIALKNAPRERQAQLVTAAKVEALKKDNPDVDKDYLKKYKQQTLATARVNSGANKSQVSVKITPDEWNAIQAGAISTSKLNKILANTNLDDVKKYATPRENKSISNATLGLIKSMQIAGFTTAEIAERVGLSTSTVSKAIKGE